MKPLICGCGSFHEPGDELHLCSSNNKIKKSSKCSARRCRSNEGRGVGEVKRSKNPFAARGLDKFSSLVADLTEKRQKIYAQSGDDSADLYVWFNFSGSDDCKPVILKLKDKKQQKPEKKELGVVKDKTTAHDKPEDTQSSLLAEVDNNKVVGAANAERVDRARKRSKSLLSSYYAYYTDRLRRRPLLCLLTATILTLMFLSVFGRSVTVMWITVGWYLLPTTSVPRSGARRAVVKKDFATKLSLNKKTIPKDDAPIMSPERVETGGQQGGLCSLAKKKEYVRRASENRSKMSPEKEHHKSR
uniref:ZCF37 n=1 Tax=Kalanchoe fedtschenkoi TaxID=63787 RepID=A0A7N0TJ20_KALFE